MARPEGLSHVCTSRTQGAVSAGGGSAGRVLQRVQWWRQAVTTEQAGGEAGVLGSSLPSCFCSWHCSSATWLCRGAAGSRSNLKGDVCGKKCRAWQVLAACGRAVMDRTDTPLAGIEKLLFHNYHIIALTPVTKSRGGGH